MLTRNAMHVRSKLLSNDIIELGKDDLQFITENWTPFLKDEFLYCNSSSLGHIHSGDVGMLIDEQTDGSAIGYTTYAASAGMVATFGEHSVSFYIVSRRFLENPRWKHQIKFSEGPFPRTPVKEAMKSVINHVATLYRENDDVLLDRLYPLRVMLDAGLALSSDVRVFH